MVGSNTNINEARRRGEMSEQAFNATMNMAAMTGAFFNGVAEEVGKERALDLLSESLENLGSTFGKAMKDQMGLDKLDVKTASSIMKGMVETYGLSSEIAEIPDRVQVKNFRCPFYEGLKMAGYEHEAIEAFCTYGPAVMTRAFVEKLGPNATYNFKKFRTAPDDFCVEEIVLEK